MENDSLTSDLRGHRTLATVVFTDCVGFSARMSVREDHTLDLIRRDLKLMRRICEQFEGRVLKSTGDGLLMYFISGVKAVECAVEIQKVIQRQTAPLRPEDCLQHRIGIHLADMFITETDVMGNGVNIAARLQSEADPGGICISQTVYDVVRSGLNLEAQYLGPRELKNIQQSIPIYRILLEPPSQSLGHSGSIDSVAQALGQNSNCARIKKLLLYACRSVWESDPHKVEALNLSTLLRELVKLSPSADRLAPLLQTAVKTLSKPAEYAAIAEVILEQAPRLYALDAAESGQSAPAQTRYEQLAQEIDYLSTSIRAKKLIFYICRNHWENDPARLNSVPLPELIADLHRLAPTPDQLRSLVNRFVQTLSKQAEYELIANVVIDRLQRLYQPEAAAAMPSLAAESEQGVYEAIAQQLETEQNWLRIKKLMLYVCRQQWESDTAALNSVRTVRLTQELHQLAPTIEQLELALGSVVRTLNKPVEYAEVARAIVHHLGQLYPNYQPQPHPVAALAPSVDSTAAPTSPPPSTQLQPAAPFFSLLDARLGIMRHTNPLRAKIVVFSALHHPFNFGEQDWLDLKMHELDGLLQQLLAACQTYTDLEALLYRAARQLQDSEENVPTATAVIKCLRVFYLGGRAMATIPVDAEATVIGETEISLDSFEASTQELMGLDEPGQTYELLRSGAEPDSDLDSDPDSIATAAFSSAPFSSKIPPSAPLPSGDRFSPEPPLEQDSGPQPSTLGEANHARE
jgi:adenylate cyclase